MISTPCTDESEFCMFPGTDVESVIPFVSGFLVVVSILKHASSSDQSHGANCTPAGSPVRSGAASASDHLSAGECCAAAGTPVPASPHDDGAALHELVPVDIVSCSAPHAGGHVPEYDTETGAGGAASVSPDAGTRPDRVALDSDLTPDYGTRSLCWPSVSRNHLQIPASHNGKEMKEKE